MPDVIYESRVRIARVKGSIRRAWLPAESQPVTFGMHGGVAEYYMPAGVPEDYETHASTIDYIVAATAG
jgi:hypothetical protein